MREVIYNFNKWSLIYSKIKAKLWAQRANYLIHHTIANYYNKLTNTDGKIQSVELLRTIKLSFSREKKTNSQEDMTMRTHTAGVAVWSIEGGFDAMGFS